MDNEKVMVELLDTLKVALSGNQTALSEVRKAMTALHLEFKDYENVCHSTDLSVSDIKTIVTKIDERIDGIDKWQKVRLPIVVGTITLVLYAIGFFFTIDKVTNMIQKKHTVPVVQIK